MKRSEQKVYRLTAAQWRALERLAKVHPKPENILDAGTRRALESRELVELVPRDGPFGTDGHRLTELGQRVYARLSVGEFCACGKPLTFEVRQAVPNVSPARWECLACARRTAA